MSLSDFSGAASLQDHGVHDIPCQPHPSRPHTSHLSSGCPVSPETSVHYVLKPHTPPSVFARLGSVVGAGQDGPVAFQQLDGVHPRSLVVLSCSTCFSVSRSSPIPDFSSRTPERPIALRSS